MVFTVKFLFLFHSTTNGGVHLQTQTSNRQSSYFTHKCFSFYIGMVLILPEISQISPGTRLTALILWTPLPLFLITLAISGSYSFRASIALSAFLSYNIKSPWKSLKCSCLMWLFSNTGKHIPYQTHIQFGMDN